MGRNLTGQLEMEWNEVSVGEVACLMGLTSLGSGYVKGIGYAI